MSLTLLLLFTLQVAAGSQVACDVRLLLFWAVDGETRTKTTVKSNVAHCKQAFGQQCCDVFLNLYAGEPRTWGEDWMKENTIGHVNSPGYKFNFLKQAYLQQKEKKTWQDYHFLWVLDSDIDFSGVNLTKFIDFSQRAGTPIVGPTFKGGGWSSMLETAQGQEGFGSLLEMGEGQNLISALNNLARPNSLCDVRHTDFVELTAPLLRPEVLPLIFEDCRRCVHPHSDWGLDMLWCELAKKAQKNATRAAGCALVDATPVVHLNWKTAKVTNEFFVALHDLNARYRRLWSKFKAFDCLVLEPAQAVNAFEVLLADGRVLLKAEDVHRA